MPECPYCDTQLPEADSETDRLDVLQDHIWTDHGEMWLEIVTGDISPETYALIQAGFQSHQIERIAEVV